MKKCNRCPHSSDKCKNRNSKNYNKFLDQITKCKPLLVGAQKPREAGDGA